MANTTPFKSFKLAPCSVCGGRVASEADLPAEYPTITLTKEEFFNYLWNMKEWTVTCEGSLGLRNATTTPVRERTLSCSVVGKFSYISFETGPFSYGITVNNGEPFEKVCGGAIKREVSGYYDYGDMPVSSYSSLPSVGAGSGQDTNPVDQNISTVYGDGYATINSTTSINSTDNIGIVFPAWCFDGLGNVVVSVNASINVENDPDFNYYIGATTSSISTGYVSLGTFTGTILGQPVQFNMWTTTEYTDPVSIVSPSFNYSINVTEWWEYL